MLLLQSRFPLPFDVYLIHYPKDSYIDWHIDPVVDGFEHHRLNIVIKKSGDGGQFRTQENGLLFKWKTRIVKFRPDTTLHSVTRCLGNRYVLSIGWLRRKR